MSNGSLPKPVQDRIELISAETKRTSEAGKRLGAFYKELTDRLLQAKAYYEVDVLDDGVGIGISWGRVDQMGWALQIGVLYVEADTWGWEHWTKAPAADQSRAIKLVPRLLDGIAEGLAERRHGVEDAVRVIDELAGK